MGGMFDPVHAGHLQLAEHVRDLCVLDQVWLVPCGNPVHRGAATATCEQRIYMLELAVENKSWLQVDARECRTSEPSRTFNTLTSIDSELPDARLFLLLGLDAFLALATWFRWRELFTLANVVVVTRPGYAWDSVAMDADLKAEVDMRFTGDKEEFRLGTSGRIMLVSLSTPAISSSQIRGMLKTDMNRADVLHPAVAGYIKANGLYQQ